MSRGVTLNESHRASYARNAIRLNESGVACLSCTRVINSVYGKVRRVSRRVATGQPLCEAHKVVYRSASPVAAKAFGRHVDAEITKIVTENASDATATHAQATARVVVRTLEQTLRLRLIQTQVFVGDPQWRVGTAADVLCQSATRADDDRFVVVEVKSSPQPYLCDVCYRSPARLARGGSYYARHQLQLWLTVTLLERAGVRVNREQSCVVRANRSGAHCYPLNVAFFYSSPQRTQTVVDAVLRAHVPTNGAVKNRSKT